MAEVKDKIVTVESLKAVYDTLNEKIMLVAHHNILDNGNFSNPVNQRGATSYTGNKYTIDRWKSNSGYSVVTINDDSLNLKSSNGNVVYLQQWIESGVIKSGHTYTVACTLKDGSTHCMSGVASTTMEDAIRYIYVNDVNLGTIRFKYDSYYGLYLVMISTSLTDGIDIVNVVLYEGEYTAETLPEYQPKGYGAELAECQRYFVAYTGRTDESSMISNGASNGTSFYSFFTLPVPMRGTEVPTVTYSGVNIYPYVVGGNVEITELLSATILDSRNHMCIRFTHASGTMSEKDVGILRLSAHGYIHISADLGVN